MKFEFTEIFNFRGAIRGMRNPKESWARSDSIFGYYTIDDYQDDLVPRCLSYWEKAFPFNDENEENKKKNPLIDLRQDISNEDFYRQIIENFFLDNGFLSYGETSDIVDVALIGPNDMDLIKRLIKGGSEHRKFLRQIIVSVDITAPRYFWTEFDTYKIGTVANSTSTMHKLASSPITIDDFEIDDMSSVMDWPDDEYITEFISYLENLRLKYVETKDKRYWKELIRWLPQSYLQTRTVTMNYENILNMMHQRDNHKLNEWSGKDKAECDNFISWANRLPYMNIFYHFTK